MGGDHAPDEIVQGAAEASLALTSAEIILVGDAAVLGRLLPRMRHDGARVRVHHAPTFVEMDEKPAEALAAKPEASIAVAADLVARGEGDALVSAGNTGASVLACARRWTLLEGVRRAALAAVYPTELRRGEKDDPFSLILDVGATIDATAEDLVGFAVMGSAYAKLVSQQPPAARRAAVERHRGRQGPAGDRRRARRARRDDRAQLHRQHRGPRHPARRRRRRRDLGLRRQRRAEDARGRVARPWCGSRATRTRSGSRGGSASIALSSAIDQLKSITDWQQYGGAPLLGFTHPFIKAHGRSNARAITNAIKVAHKALAGNLCGNIARTMAELDERAQRPRAPTRRDERAGWRWRRRSLLAPADDACRSQVGERIGLLDHVPPGLPPGAPPPQPHVPLGSRQDVPAHRVRLARAISRRARSRPPPTSRRIPGATALLRALRQDGNRICIVSGSPTQMRQVLAAKLALDGVEYDEFVLKNNLKNILRGRFRALRAQIPYKLPAMLQSRIGATAERRDAVRRRRRGRRDHLLPVRRSRRRPGLARGSRARARSRRARTTTTPTASSSSRGACPRTTRCSRMFIHLDRRSPPVGFRRFGPRLVPVFNYFQAALVLYEDNVLSARQVIFVALEMLDSEQYELGHLATSVQDVIRRGRVTPRDRAPADRGGAAKRRGRARCRAAPICRRSSRSPSRSASGCGSWVRRRSWSGHTRRCRRRWRRRGRSIT